MELAGRRIAMAVRLFPPGSEREQAARNLAIAGGNLTAAQISDNERKAEALRREFATVAPEPAGEAAQPAVTPELEAAGAVAAKAPEGPAAVKPAVAEAEAEVAAVEPAAAAEQAAPQVASPAEQVSPQLPKPKSAAVDVAGARAAEGVAAGAPAGEGLQVAAEAELAAEAEVAAAAAVEPAAGLPAEAPVAEPEPQAAAEPPVQAVVAPPVQTPEPASARRYVIQLASLNDTDTAMAEKTRLENKYAELLGEVEMSVQRAELDNRGTVFRIVIGPYAEKAPADELCGQLKVRNQDCYVVRR